MVHKKKFIFVADYDIVIGNLCEKILYALFKAERQNKQILFVRKRIPFSSIFKRKFRYVQRGAVYRLAGVFLGKPPFWIDEVIGCYYGGMVFIGFAGRAILCKLKILRELNLQFIGCGCKDLFNVNVLKYFDSASVSNIDWKYFLEKKQKLYFCDEDQLYCEKTMEHLGIHRNKPYVCLHIRTQHYYNDSSYSSYRNSNIENYIEGLKCLKAAGFQVIRLGDSVDLGYHQYYIDYPNTVYKSELMDLFLIKNCKFYLGTNSGILDAAFLLGVPVLAVNVTDYLFVQPYKTSDIYIYKHVFSNEQKRFLTYNEIFKQEIGINGAFDSHQIHQFNQRYTLHDNSSKEIQEAIKEMCENLENMQKETDAQVIFKKKLIQAVLRWISNETYHTKHLENAYRALTKTYFNGRIGRHFAEKYLYGTVDLPYEKEKGYETE